MRPRCRAVITSTSRCCALEQDGCLRRRSLQQGRLPVRCRSRLRRTSPMWRCSMARCACPEATSAWTTAGWGWPYVSRASAAPSGSQSTWEPERHPTAHSSNRCLLTQAAPRSSAAQQAGQTTGAAKRSSARHACPTPHALSVHERSACSTLSSALEIASADDERGDHALLFADWRGSLLLATGSPGSRLRSQLLTPPGRNQATASDPQLAVAPSGLALATWSPPRAPGAPLGYGRRQPARSRAGPPQHRRRIHRRRHDRRHCRRREFSRSGSHRADWHTNRGPRP